MQIEIYKSYELIFSHTFVAIVLVVSVAFFDLNDRPDEPKIDEKF